MLLERVGFIIVDLFRGLIGIKCLISISSIVFFYYCLLFLTVYFDCNMKKYLFDMELIDKE